MSVHYDCRAVILTGAALLLMGAAPAVAQDGTMKACGEKWQAAKAAGATAGTSWPKFLAECRSGASTKAAVASDGKSAAGMTTAGKAEAVKADASSKVKAPAPQPKGTIVFPSAVSPKFSTLSAGRARRKTCSEQYQANKANNANGGLRWLEKGGGYWSLCNAKLKT